MLSSEDEHDIRLIRRAAKIEGVEILARLLKYGLPLADAIEKAKEEILDGKADE